MRTIRTKVYKFDELTPQAQNKAVELLQDINTDHNWWTLTYEDFKTLSSYFGVDVDLKKTYFSLSYSQSDGSSYTANVDVCKLISCIKSEGWRGYAPKENFKIPTLSKNADRVHRLMVAGWPIAEEIKIWVEPINRETNIKVEMEADVLPENITKAVENLFDIAESICKQLNKFLFRSLSNESEYISSREAIIETIKANEYDFFKDGKLYDNR